MLEGINFLIELFDIPYLVTNYGYMGIFTIVFLESGIFFPLPGDSLLFTAGILASTTYLKIYILIPLIFTATFLGGIAGYHIGIHIERLRKYSFFAKMLKQEHIDKTHVFFEKYGKHTILFSRFIPIVRTFTPIVAGIVKMDYRLFIKYSLVSSIVWSTLMTMLGYFSGRLFPQIKDYLTGLIFLVVLLSLLPVLVEILRRKKKSI